MKKRGFCDLKKLALSLVLLLVLFSPLSYAETNETLSEESPSDLSLQGNFRAQAANWLYNKTHTVTPPPFDQSLAILALTSSGKDVSSLVSRLLQLQDPQGCWPSSACTVKDTSLAVLVMHKLGQREAAEKGEAWLKKTLASGLKREWWLEIKSSESGTCTLRVDEGSPKTITIENDKLKPSRSQYYLQNNEIEPGLVNKVAPVIHVDCSGLPGTANPIIALVYHENPTTFYLLESYNSFSADLRVSNACFAAAVGSQTCSDESTFIASWALSEIYGSEVSKKYPTLTYVQTKIKPSLKIIELSLANRALQSASKANPYHLSLLSKEQEADGGWGDVYSSSWALLALKPSAVEFGEAISRGDDYLQRTFDTRSQSWNEDIRTTSLALLALEGRVVGGSVDFTQTNAEKENRGRSTEIFCSDGLDDDGDTLIDCGDSLDCKDDSSCGCLNGIADGDEEGIDCGGSCARVCSLETDEPVVDDEPIEKECQADADCGEGKNCVQNSCVIPPKKERSLWWLWLLPIVLIIGGSAFFYFYYVRTDKVNLSSLFRRKNKTNFDDFKQQYRPQVKPSVPIARPAARPSTSPSMKPLVRSQPPQKSKEDLELEKSLEEAERILKGK